MAARTPLALVKEKFGDKEKLVEALEKLTSEDLWVNRANKEKGLARVSNAKLLHLYRLFTEVKEKFGTREKLIDQLLGLENRTKDQGLRQKYAAWPVPRLYDAYRSMSNRIARAKAEAAETAKAKKAGKKVPAKKAAKAAAEKTAAKGPAAKKAAKAPEPRAAEAKAGKAAKAKAKE